MPLKENTHWLLSRAQHHSNSSSRPFLHLRPELPSCGLSARSAHWLPATCFYSACFWARLICRFLRDSFLISQLNSDPQTVCWADFTQAAPAAHWLPKKLLGYFKLNLLLILRPHYRPVSSAWISMNAHWRIPICIHIKCLWLVICLNWLINWLN